MGLVPNISLEIFFKKNALCLIFFTSMGLYPNISLETFFKKTHFLKSFYKYGVISKHFFGNIFQKTHFFKMFYKYGVISKHFFGNIFQKKHTFLRNIDCFMCFKNIHASCLRGGRRNLPNCPGPSPSRPGKKYPVRVNPSLRYIYIY